MLAARSAGDKDSSIQLFIVEDINYLGTMRIHAFLAESPMFAIGRAARRFDALASQALGADRLSFFEGLLLAAIYFETPKPVKPSHLAETFGTTRSNVSHSIASLEAKGLVQRKIDPSDARAYQLSLTPQGRKCALRAVSAFEKLQRAFEREIGKPAMIEMLKTIRRLEVLFPLKN
jgi:DNA-binding MarR family transcriptional regulator